MAQKNCRSEKTTLLEALELLFRIHVAFRSTLKAIVFKINLGIYMYIYIYIYIYTLYTHGHSLHTHTSLCIYPRLHMCLISKLIIRNRHMATFHSVFFSTQLEIFSRKCCWLAGANTIVKPGSSMWASELI